MSWIAVVGDGHNWVDPSLSARRTTGIDRPMRRGTLMIEADAPTLATGPALIRLNRSGGAQGVMSLQWVPAMGLVLLFTQMDQVFHATLPYKDSATRLRVSFSWDLDRKTARLAIEDPKTGDRQVADFADPLPLFLSDFWSLTRGAGTSELGSGVQFLAVSEAVEPLGPMPSLLSTARVETPDGLRALDSLLPGDLVRTADGNSVPVLHVVTHTVPSAGSYRPIYVKPQAFGLSDPLITAPNQTFVMSGAEVEYTYDSEAVRVRAAHLPAHCARRQDRADSGPLVTFAQLILPEAEIMICEGAPVESLNIGRLRRDKQALEQSLLAGVSRNLLPEHVSSTYPLLSATEALAVVTEQTAETA